MRFETRNLVRDWSMLRCRRSGNLVFVSLFLLEMYAAAAFASKGRLPSILQLSSSHTSRHRLLRAGGTHAKGKSSPLFSSTFSDLCNDAQSFIDEINADYEQLHRSFENNFWATKMALASPEYSTDELVRTKAAMETFLASEEKLARTRALLQSDRSEQVLSDAQRSTLLLFERTFGCYIMESPEARRLRGKATALEGQLEKERNDLVLGTVDPHTGALVEELSSVGLRNKMRVSEDEAVRQSCFEGLAAIPSFVVNNGFIELVAARNAMAKALGYEDYYDYKVTQAEGFGKHRLFDMLDELERDTRPLMETARAKLVDEKSGICDPLLPWNTGFVMAGDVTKKMDPYFPFEKSVERWGRSFARLGIGYRGATMDLDLLDRKRKYSNGFCHWPQPAWVKPDGTWQPSVAHFTSLADPSALGSGLTGLTTLMHEAGHAAHFANIAMPSPLFSQERAPTSVPYAELQSMFLDSLVGDAAWRRRYAKTRDGEVMPFELIEESLRSTKPYEVFSLRSMLAVPYFEKALYEMDASELSAEAILALADKVERDIQGGLSARPLLTVPHLLSDEASCCKFNAVWCAAAVAAIIAHPVVLPLICCISRPSDLLHSSCRLLSRLAVRQLVRLPWICARRNGGSPDA